jgi:hypothetical protein
VRLLGAAHVRNEADIVEAFVRHDLVLLDGIAIVDHASVDATPDILRALKDEGLPIVLARDESPRTTSKRCRTGWSVICFRRRRQRGFFRSVREPAQRHLGSELIGRSSRTRRALRTEASMSSPASKSGTCVAHSSPGGR